MLSIFAYKTVVTHENRLQYWLLGFCYLLYVYNAIFLESTYLAVEVFLINKLAVEAFLESTHLDVEVLLRSINLAVSRFSVNWLA